MTAAKTKAQSSFGSTDQLKSGRWRARYRLPGSTRGAPFITAPHTFIAKRDAETWLSIQRANIAKGEWVTVDSDTTFKAYAKAWMDSPPRPQKRRTADDYQRLLDDFILPSAFASMKLKDVRPEHIRRWYKVTCVDTPTQRAHCYSLVKSIFKTAVIEDLIPANPCKIEGASTAKRASKTEPASIEELMTIRMSVPDRYRLMIDLAAWCAMRFGELTELRVYDFDFKREVIKVRRAITWVKGEAVVGKPEAADDLDAQVTLPLIGTPKSEAGTRDVAIPPHLIPSIKDHISRFAPNRDSLLFPAARNPDGNMRPATLYKVYYPAREKAGRKDLRFHDLRHTGAVLYAQAGATIAELMERLGHSTPAAAMRYQHAAKGRAAVLATALSAMATPEHVILEAN